MTNAARAASVPKRGIWLRIWRAASRTPRAGSGRGAPRLPWSGPRLPRTRPPPRRARALMPRAPGSPADHAYAGACDRTPWNRDTGRSSGKGGRRGPRERAPGAVRQAGRWARARLRSTAGDGGALWVPPGRRPRGGRCPHTVDGPRSACGAPWTGRRRVPRQGAPPQPTRGGGSAASQTGAPPLGTHWDRLGRPKTRRRSRRLSSRRRRTALQEAGADAALDRLKYEVAEELGLRDDVEKRGWAEMTTREVGTIGGHMVRRMIRFAERHMPEGGARAGGRADT